MSWSLEHQWHRAPTLSERHTPRKRVGGMGEEASLPSIDPIRRADCTSTRSASTWVAGAIIIGTISFNAVLCYVNTRGFPINDLLVMLSEVLLISAAVLACRNYLNPIHLSILALIVLYTVAHSALRYIDTPANGFDPKISRDFIIPVVFYLLGQAINDIKAADRIVIVATTILLVFAVFEYFFLDAFLHVFSVAEYYVARGTLAASELAHETSQGLMVSGIRPADQGRTLLPFLGDHRVSSLFLEPSTLGNFGMLVTLWAVVRSRMEGKLYVFCALGGAALIILSDTRFDAFFLVLAIAILMLPPRLVSPAVFVLPFVTMLALYAFAGTADPFHGAPMLEGRGTYDRLLYSGRVLLSFNIYNWVGLEPSPSQTFDSGYGYIISNVGIIGFALLWTLFMSLRGSNRFFYAFHNALAVYFTTLLCISASIFTIKFAAMLWFLLGALSIVTGEKRPRVAARDIEARASASGERLWRPSCTESPANMSLVKATW
jgi:putative polymerase